MKQYKFTLTIAIFLLVVLQKNYAQNTSVAMLWNKQILKAITKDFARPPIHSRNLFHLSIAMHDAWAAYEPDAEKFLLGKSLGGFTATFLGVPIPADVEAARHKAISYAAYRLIKHRFANSPGVLITTNNINNVMDSLGYDINYTSIDYINGGPAALGNYIANRVIAYGYTDGSNEINNYASQYYQPVNPKILVEQPGNPNMIHPNRWQAISLSVAIDQAGNLLTSDPPHLAPEWGNVKGFALADSVMTLHSRDGQNYKVYHDQGDPVYMDTLNGGGFADFFKWNFSMVSAWQSHLDTTDGVMWDISPASQGNIPLSSLPNTYADYENFYDFENGGDAGVGYAVNPVTGQPYTPQIVKRGDYARVLAEFWADGLDSETPAGHWFNIYNKISLDPLYVKQWGGQGPVLSDLEYDVKTYLTLGGAMHDVAISAWSHKGWYDYVRPVSAIRYMADQGQSTDTSLSNYNPKGIPLKPGFIEVVAIGDPLAGANNEHVGKIKLYTWKGPTYIQNPQTDMAGVGWILAENWWPYQRPTFVTPPFAGYVSGHSTFSRTAAEIMTSITGNPFFPGGMSNFVAQQNEFLHFEEGPSETIVLQWATYRDASDQCSLSRIWGGIHPPMDDIPGRKIGVKVAANAFTKANNMFSIARPNVNSVSSSLQVVNTASIGDTLTLTITFNEAMEMSIAPTLTYLNAIHPLTNTLSVISAQWENNTTYKVSYLISAYPETMNNVALQVKGCKNLNNTEQNVFVSYQPFRIDKQNPVVSNIQYSNTLINDAVAGNQLSITLKFNEKCNTSIHPVLQFVNQANLGNTLILNSSASGWTNDTTFKAVYNVIDNNEIVDSIGINVENANDLADNTQLTYDVLNALNIDTRNAEIVNVTVNDSLLTISNIGGNALLISLSFDKDMNQTINPVLNFSNGTLLGTSLTLNSANTSWQNANTCQVSFNLQNVVTEEFNIGVILTALKDVSGNSPSSAMIDSMFSIDTKRPSIIASMGSTPFIADNNVGSGTFSIDLTYSESMKTIQKPVLRLLENNILLTDASYDIFGSTWLNDTTYQAKFNITDNDVEKSDIALEINFGEDASGNPQSLIINPNWIDLDTKNPNNIALSSNTYLVNTGSTNLQLIAIFDEAADVSQTPIFEFTSGQNLSSFLSFDMQTSSWLNSFTYKAVYNLANTPFWEDSIDVKPTNVFDIHGNPIVEVNFTDFFEINYDPTSTFELDETSEVVMYPNPIASTSTLKFISSDSKQMSQLQILSSDGKIVFDNKLQASNNGIQSIELPFLSDGLYFAIGVYDNIQKEWKLIIKN